ncbi:N-acetylated-alpha-linked acidic dipeptidase 2 [Taenia crassiceps]|uniref:N-acetylated-alpha-linked acidic dipeptidase 2 n=1 Tax=Taenia crassiceps TaxID=6207 RepID=A0ABR4QT44_9CEST
MISRAAQSPPKMALRNAFILVPFLVWSSVAAKDYCKSNWRDVYRELQDQLPKGFPLKQLSYFAGWRLHQGGTYESSQLAGKQLQDWKRWGWPIVKTVNFTVRLPRGPPEGGPWNEVAILERSTHTRLQSAQNYVTFNCTDRRPHGNGTCLSEENFTVPAYCGFAGAGSATGRPVFVNYARGEDLAVFTSAQDLCLQDIIVVARHGYKSYGSKVRQVMKRCASLGSSTLPGGMIIYRDPKDSVPDIKVYPEGIGLPNDGVAYRVSSLSKRGGDSETPGFPAIDGVYKIERAEDQAVTPFPVQTINYNDAEVIINGFGGKPIPKAWEPSTIKFMGPEGDNLIQIEVRNRIDETPSTLVDAIGIMPGRGPEGDKYVIFGNHRDAWVQGASDPHSGTVVLQGIAYLLGLAYQEGWRPKRTIVIASWDAEEVGLIGSTEFTELYRNELVAKAVVYLNQDSPVKGDAVFSARADQFLEKALLDSAKIVPGPCNASMSFLKEWSKRTNRKNSKRAETVPVGGFTDHVPFQFQLGVPSTYLQFTPKPPLYEAPSYHTAYDSVAMAVNFTDPPCSTDGGLLPLHRLLIRYHFHLLLKFSSSRRLPIYPLPKAITLKRSWSGIVDHADKILPNISTRYGINLGYISERVEDFLNASKAFEKSFDKIEKERPRCYPVYNDILSRLSKQFITNENVPTPRHVLVDSSYTTTHYDSYFPKVRSFIQKLSQSTDEKSSEVVKELKTELSALVTAFTAASNLLRGGLLGVESLHCDA